MALINVFIGKMGFGRGGRREKILFMRPSAHSAATLLLVALGFATDSRATTAAWSSQAREGLTQICVRNVFSSGTVPREHAGTYCKCLMERFSEKIAVEGAPAREELERIYRERLTPAYAAPENSRLHHDCAPFEGSAAAAESGTGPEIVMSLVQAHTIVHRPRGEIEYRDARGWRIGSSRPGTAQTTRDFYDAKGVRIGRSVVIGSGRETRYLDQRGNFVAKTTRAADGRLDTYDSHGVRVGSARTRLHGGIVDYYDAAGRRMGTSVIRK